MNAKREEELRQLTEGWGLDIKDFTRLNQALTHPTYVFENKHKGLAHNQRLEFLGDAVLGLAVGEYLYQSYPQRPEGELTKMRAAVVCEASLAERSRSLGLGKYLLLGRGEELSGGRNRSSILADVFEAVIGAVYLDAGWDVVKEFILKQLVDAIKNVDTDSYGDYKTMLQELVQKYGEESVSYLILKESGPDHHKKFVAGVTYHDRLLARGSGNSKKEAEQKAARAALKNLDTWKQYLGGDGS
ncbi:MAG: ribonuclease III [Desulfitobacteriaceae bacterium]|nr:ribonuclease III [Desulfitobacteriaceae bacterium]